MKKLLCLTIISTYIRDNRISNLSQNNRFTTEAMMGHKLGLFIYKNYFVSRQVRSFREIE